MVVHFKSKSLQQNFNYLYPHPFCKMQELFSNPSLMTRLVLMPRVNIQSMEMVKALLLETNCPKHCNQEMIPQMHKSDRSKTPHF